LGGAYICHHGDAHAGETGDQAAGGTDEEANACGKIFKVANGGEEKEGDYGNSLELAVKVCGGTFLDGGCDFAHTIVAIRLTFDPCD
jgi:hypothetical protein